MSIRMATRLQSILRRAQPIRSTPGRSLLMNSCKTDEKYSWLKSPRYNDKPMEVGPLARTLVAYASGDQQVKQLVDSTLAKLKLPPTALFSTLGRVAAGLLRRRSWSAGCPIGSRNWTTTWPMAMCASTTGTNGIRTAGRSLPGFWIS